MPTKTAKSPIESKLLEKEPEIIEAPKYTDKEQTYLKKLQKRLESAKRRRETAHRDFNEMTYSQYWRHCEDLAGTYTRPKKDKSDVRYQSGTLRTKLFSFLSSLIGLNLSGDITAFDKDDMMVNGLGDAMETVIEKTDELDNDEEKKLVRLFELLKQGTVFLEEIWDDKWIVEKTAPVSFDGKFRGVPIKTKTVKAKGRPVRNIISGLAVYLGDINQYDHDEQPYTFTVQLQGHEEAEQTYKDFEMWKYVSKKKKSWMGEADLALVSNAWRLTETTDNQVEIIKYRDKPNNEYQIIINGIPMLPIGFPFPWGYNEYNMAQQNLKPFRHDFAYGTSFIFENKNPVMLLDEMMKLAMLKTQKSFMPPYLNIGNKIISPSVFMPGKITMGLDKDSLMPVDQTGKQTEGVTSGEFNMMQQLIEDIDRNTASQTFTGAKEFGGPVTATQIVELQRQARIMMGVFIASASLMERKLITLRLFNVLKNWFNPIDTAMDEARGMLRNRYRTVSMKKQIEGRGAGVKMVIPSEEEGMLDSEGVMQMEDILEEETGALTEVVLLNPKEIQEARYTWVVRVNPREKKSSELSKMMFGAMITDANALGLPLEPSYVQERFAQVWGEDASKMFAKQEEAPETGMPPGEGQESSRMGSPKISPQIKLPTEGGAAPSSGRGLL